MFAAVVRITPSILFTIMLAACGSVGSIKQTFKEMNSPPDYSGEPHRTYNQVSNRDHLPASAVIAADPKTFAESAFSTFDGFLNKDSSAESSYDLPQVTGANGQVLANDVRVLMSVASYGYYLDRSMLVLNTNLPGTQEWVCGTLGFTVDGYNAKNKLARRNHDDLACVQKYGNQPAIMEELIPAYPGLTEDKVYYHANRDPAAQEAITAACKATDLATAVQTRVTKEGSQMCDETGKHCAPYDGPKLLHHAVYQQGVIELTSFGRALLTRNEAGSTAEVRYGQVRVTCP